MAQGSETIRARWVEGAERRCVCCGIPITNLMRQVGEVRTTYGERDGVTVRERRELWCMDCRPGSRLCARPASLCDPAQLALCDPVLTPVAGLA